MHVKMNEAVYPIDVHCLVNFSAKLANGLVVVVPMIILTKPCTHLHLTHLRPPHLASCSSLAAEWLRPTRLQPIYKEQAAAGEAG